MTIPVNRRKIYIQMSGIVSENRLGGYRMARGRKKQVNLTLEEQLKAVNDDIAACEEQIKALKQKRKEIDKLIKEEKKEALFKAVEESGKSIDDILSALSGE